MYGHDDDYAAEVGMRIWARVLLGVFVGVVCLVGMLLYRCCCRKSRTGRVLAPPVSPASAGPAHHPTITIATMPTSAAYPVAAGHPTAALYPTLNAPYQPPQPTTTHADVCPPSYAQVVGACNEKEPPYHMS